jgi:hypothetical protein
MVFPLSSIVGAKSMISEEGLGPLRDVVNLSNLGSRVGMGEVSVMGDQKGEVGSDFVFLSGSNPSVETSLGCL